MNVRVRGIYATALTRLLADEGTVVQASAPIRERFDAAFPVAPADVAVAATADRQGVGVTGDPGAVEAAADALGSVGRDVLAWPDPAALDAVFDAAVTDELGSGAVVDLGEREGFLPYRNADSHVTEGDRLRVQVRDPVPPWADDRPVLDTALEVSGGLARLVRGAAPGGSGGAADLVDLVPADPPEGWGVRWDEAADDAEFDALASALEALGGCATALDAALADDPPKGGPDEVWAGVATRWVRFGRESRRGLDEHRSEVTTTMPGHHRIKAVSDAAGDAVGLVEAVCDPGGEFPFDAVTRQFGPREGDLVAIAHGKPDGREFPLGRGEVTERDPEGSVTVRREMSPGGTYDALGVERRAGDVAVTQFTEGRWWYPTVYRSAEGERRGTYVNVCTPVEVFPDAVRYVDLHVDVVKHTDGTVERVDDGELDAAVAAGHLPGDLAEKARGVAAAVVDALS